MKTSLIVVFSLLVATAPVRADISAARAAVFAGDPAPALALAIDGDVAAQELLAGAYLTGRGVARDPAVAAGWFLRAGEQGSLGASIMLAQLYADGTGVAQDMA